MKRNLVFWRGPSGLNGQGVIGAITGLAQKSVNTKTGPMLQAYILVAGQSPIDAVKTGADAAICGDCKLRGDGPVGRACYVAWYRGPQNIHKALAGYDDLPAADAAERLAGRQLRVGAYGDPAAIPFEVWQALLGKVAGWTGYTHHWRTCDQRFRGVLMASVDTPDEADLAAAWGWRTFRLRRTGDHLRPGEIRCPASDEAGRRTVCAACTLCRGQAVPAKSIAILPHGRRTKWLTNAVSR